jgi:polygalacturonase
MKNFKILLLVIFASTINATGVYGKKYEYAHLYKDLAFDMPKVLRPVFPKRSVSVSDFGGVGDGVTLNTDAFAKAMKHLSAKGGGKLIVPFGVWFTGPIVFESNINLYLEEGAIILFTPDFNAYPLVKTSFEGLETYRCQSPISGKNLVNIAITGKGIINGSGEAWRPLKKSKVTDNHWKQTLASGGVLKAKDFWFPSEKSLKGEMLSDKNLNVPRKAMTMADWEEVRDFLRPVLVSFTSCKNVLLEGVVFENSPSWNIHPLMCENLIVDGVIIRNPSFAQNGDGIDIESCKNVLLVNSTLDVGDDAICIKSGKDEDGRRRAIPTENVIVDNCIVFKGHGGFVVGSEMSGGVRNVSVSNCKFVGTHVGLRFKSTRGRGGVVENIYINNISMVNILTEAFLFDLYYGGKSSVEVLEDGDEATQNRDLQPVTVETPVFRNIYVKNLVSRGSRRAMFFNGLPEMNISNIHVENVSISSEYGAEISESDGITFKNVFVSPAKGPALILNSVKNMKTEGFTYPKVDGKEVEFRGRLNKNVEIK